MKERPIEPAAEQFVSRLEELAAPGAEDRASLARLKRAAGLRLGECSELMPLFYRLLSRQIHTWDEERYFLVATLFPFTPRRWSGDLGASLRLVRQHPKVNGDGIDRRVSVLLDAGGPELSFRLRQAVRLLAQHEAPIDWRQLLEDLRRWDWQGRPVQKQWARSYFGWQSEGESASSSLAVEPNDK